MTTFATWKLEMEKRLKYKDTLIDGLEREITEFRNRSEKAKEDQPKVIEDLNNIKEQVKTLEEEQRKVQETSSWAEKLFQTQKKAEEAEKWIETAKKGKGSMPIITPPFTIISFKFDVLATCHECSLFARQFFS